MINTKESRAGAMACIEAIKADAENQTPSSIKANMGILAESMKNLLAIDNIYGLDVNRKVGSD